MPATSSARALFLDRDGVINVDHGYVHTREKFELVEGIGEVLRSFSDAGYVLIIVTNQAGIARGHYSEAEFLAFDTWVRDELARRFDVHIARTYHAPHHPEGTVTEFRGESPLRKPNPGMILAAQREFDLDLAQSVLVGDKESDVVAGKRAGVGFTVLLAPDGPREGTVADLVISGLPELVAPKATRP